MTDEDRALVGKQGGSFAFLGMDTTDCVAVYNRMKALDVKFQGEPTSGPWGTGVLFEDLYRNKIFYEPGTATLKLAEVSED